MSIRQDLIPDVTLGQKCHMNMDQILNGYREMGIWNAAEAPIYGLACDNPHGTLESNFQHRFPVKVYRWWSTEWTIHLPTTFDRWHLHWIFAKWTAGPLRECFSPNRCTTNFTGHLHISLGMWRCIWIISWPKDQPWRFRRICHRSHRISVRYISMRGVTWKRGVRT
jgi:hypothetical protein